MGTNAKLLVLAIVAALATACTVQIGDTTGVGPENPAGGHPANGKFADDDWGISVGDTHLDYVEHLPRGQVQYDNFCSQNLNNRLSNWYCAGDTAPQINGLEDVLVGLGLKNAGQPDALAQNTRFAISGHSSSLVTRATSVLNPRAVIFTRDGTPDYTALGFIRGDGFAEVAAFDTVRGDIDFMLVSYKKSCEPDCSNAERFLPENETNWANVAVYSDKDLANTVFDCLQCHEPEGAGTGRILRMQELVDPWTHWFRDNRGTNSMLQQFQTYHVDEVYAGIPAAQITNSDPADLEDLVRAAGFGNQPNLFEGDQINQDDVNVTEPNATWMALYQNAVEGRMIAPPFFGISPYDDLKVQDAGETYRAVADGSAPRENMPDLTDLFRPDAKRYLSMGAASGLDAIGIVQHKCGTCHDGRFPGVSRDNFRIQDFPSNLTPELANKISARVGLPHYSRLRMPPAAFADLTDDEVQLIRDAMK